MTTLDALDELSLPQKMELWQKLFAQTIINKEALDGPARLRLSQTGQCQRKLHYIHSRETPTEPTTLTRLNKLAMGHALEVLAILAFKSYGWETQHTCIEEGGQITLEIQVPGLEDPVTGHPDGICRHEIYTESEWIPFECKSTSEFRANLFEELGIAKVEPSYIMQIAMYGRLMFERGIVDHAGCDVFAFISREGRLLPPERIKWNPNLSDRGVLRLAHAVHTTNEGQPPDRPYDDPNEEPCSYCPFRKICWSDRLLDELQPIVRGAATPLDHDQETFEAAAQWLQAKQALDQAKAVLESKLIANANAPISAAGVKAEYFRPSDARSYDMHELGGYLTGEILRRHQNANADKRVFWVHPL